MKNCKIRVVIWLAIVLFMAAACSVGGEPDEESKDDKSNNEIAVVELENGGHVKFISPEPGELIVAMLSAKPLEEEITTLSPVELYESLTGKPAPKEIIDACQNEEEVVSSEEEEEEDSYGISEPDKPVNTENNAKILGNPLFDLDYVGRMTGDTFRRKYGGLLYGDGADYVWTDIISGWAQSKAYNVQTDLVNNRGEAFHYIKAKKNSLSSWKTKYSAYVPMGYHSYYMYGTSKKRWKRCAVEESQYSNRPILCHLKITFRK